MSEKISITQIMKEGFRENYKPGLVLQASALAVVLFYFFNPGFHSLLVSLGQWKNRSGILFAGFSTAFFGGLVPFVFMFFTDREKMKRKLPLLLFYLLFWFWKGMEVDLLYRFQAYLFGNSNHWLVVIKKVACDQLIYGPLWAAPTMMIFYLWKDSDFSISAMKNKLNEDSLMRRILRVWASNLVVWIPAVSIIYLLPLDLQIPLFNLVIVFWTLILNSVASK